MSPEETKEMEAAWSKPIDWHSFYCTPMGKEILKESLDNIPWFSRLIIKIKWLFK